MLIAILAACVLTSIALGFELKAIAPKLRSGVRFLIATLTSLALFAIVVLIFFYIGEHVGV
jgi:hypothetical protein